MHFLWLYQGISYLYRNCAKFRVHYRMNSIYGGSKNLVAILFNRFVMAIRSKAIAGANHILHIIRFSQAPHAQKINRMEKREREKTTTNNTAMENIFTFNWTSKLVYHANNLANKWANKRTENKNGKRSNEIDSMRSMWNVINHFHLQLTKCHKNSCEADSFSLGHRFHNVRYFWYSQSAQSLFICHVFILPCH